MKLGSHVGMSGKEMLLGSAKEAKSYGANVFMAYTGAPQNTRRKDISELRIPEAHEYMKENGISDIYELYSEYIGRVADYVLSIGKTPIVWEGFPRKGVSRIPKETIVLAWEYYYNIAPDLIEDGFRIINASPTPLYTVNSQKNHFRPSEILKWNVHKFDSSWKQSKAYGGVEIEPSEQLLGAMMCSWQQTYEQEINYIMENSAVISERMWNVEPRCSDEELMEKFEDIRSVTKVPRLIQER